MRIFRFLTFLTLLLISTVSIAQTLYINEVSQGPSGNKEYVEFIVVGEPSCTNPPPCLDMRGKIFDDNNGYFRNQNSSGIAAGAMRFSDNEVWQCVPIGTLIVVYNNSDRNANIPADDLTDANGDMVRIIPGNSSLFDRHPTIPSQGANNNYVSSGWVNGGAWQNHLAMAGDSDSFQIRESLTSASPTHAVSWGNNSNNNIIYFSGSASGKVFNMMNTINNNPSLQANWASEAAPARETPGQPNSPENAAWINALRNGTATNNIQLTIDPTNSGCGTLCTGSAIATATGGAAPYTYEWNTGETTASLTGICAGTYTVEVTDALGCTQEQQVTISAGNTNMNVTITKVDDGCTAACTGAATATVTGGNAPYTYDWTNGSTTATANELCQGNYTVNVTDAAGCVSSATVSIASNTNIPEVSIQTITESCANACDGSASATVTAGTAPYSFEWSNGSTASNITDLCAGNISLTVTDQNGCQAIANATINTGAIAQTPTITPVATLSVDNSPVPLQASISGGLWTGNGVQVDRFNPQIAGAGSHQVCYSVGSGQCAQQACIEIVVEAACVDQTFTQNIKACPGESIIFDGTLISDPSTQTFTYTLLSGCDSNVVVNFSYHTTNPSNTFATACLGDSVDVNGQYFHQTQVVYYETVDDNQCILQNSTLITFTDCEIPEFSIFIPNTFTPNGDFVNDLFIIHINNGYLLEGYIFNRWGQIVREFASNDLTWDGTTQNGSQSPDGVYTYTVRVQKDSSVTELYTGFVTIVR